MKKIKLLLLVLPLFVVAILGILQNKFLNFFGNSNTVFADVPYDPGPSYDPGPYTYDNGTGGQGESGGEGCQGESQGECQGD